MLDKNPERGRALTKGKRGKRRAARRAEWNPLAEAFRDHGIDPSEPDAREQLLETMVLRHYHQPWRPKGSSKWDERRRAQLMWDVLKLKKDFSPGEGKRKLNNKQIAGLLKERYPDRYPTESTPWLRQCVSMVDQARVQLSEEDLCATLILVTASERIPATDAARRHDLVLEVDKHFQQRVNWERVCKSMALVTGLISLLPLNPELDTEDTKQLRKFFKGDHLKEEDAKRLLEAVHILKEKADQA
jgi:hypothetical protein